MRCIKYATGVTLAGALAVAAASSAYGQYYYGPGFYAGNAYAFEPAPVVPVYPYAAPAYGFVYVPPPTCWNSTSDSRNFGYYGHVRGVLSTRMRKLLDRRGLTDA
jgi:hypothetical protein